MRARTRTIPFMTILGALLSLPAQAQERVVNFYNWSNYMAPGVLRILPKRTGIQGCLRYVRRQRDAGDAAAGGKIADTTSSSPRIFSAAPGLREYFPKARQVESCPISPMPGRR